MVNTVNPGDMTPHHGVRFLLADDGDLNSFKDDSDSASEAETITPDVYRSNGQVRFSIELLINLKLTLVAHRIIQTTI